MSNSKRQKRNTYREKFLFQIVEHAAHQVVDDGDNSEPPELVDRSIIVVRDSCQNEASFTAEELDDFARTWLRFRKLTS